MLMWGWDGMDFVITGHMYSQTTFGANNRDNCNIHGNPRDHDGLDGFSQVMRVSIKFHKI